MKLMNEHHYDLAPLGMPAYSPAPSTYQDAMSRKDKPKWWKSMYIEFENMHDKHLWRIVKRTDVPYGRRNIGNRWFYALKEDGTYRA
jgi:hypothetical protein